LFLSVFSLVLFPLKLNLVFLQTAPLPHAPKNLLVTQRLSFRSLLDQIAVFIAWAEKVMFHLERTELGDLAVRQVERLSDENGADFVEAEGVAASVVAGRAGAFVGSAVISFTFSIKASKSASTISCTS